MLKFGEERRQQFLLIAAAVDVVHVLFWVDRYAMLCELQRGCFLSFSPTFECSISL